MTTRLLTTCLAALCAAGMMAQNYDITKIYLRNAGFDNHFDYTIDDTGNVAQEILDVEGWTKDISVNYTITGVYQIGTKKTFNDAAVPATAQDGSTDGGVLALSTGWNQSMLFYQTVELPKGKYSLVTAFYNSADKTAGRSRVAWLPNRQAEQASTLEGFPTGKWLTDTIRFELDAPTRGKIQVGFHANENVGSANFAKPCLDFVKLLRDTDVSKEEMDIYKQQLNAVIEQAQRAYGDGSGNGADNLLEAINAAKAVMDDDHATTDQVDAAVAALEEALDRYLWDNPTGNVPTVTTNPRYARGATMAFGRMGYSGVTAAEVTEQGFCWSQSPDPTINDQRTTRFLTNNGRIYWLDDLKPATCYYMRAYVITKGRQVGYGDVIRFYTIPKGQISFTLRESNDAGANARISAAAQQAIDWWNKLTEMKGFRPSIGYNAGVPTAECSYGGWMSVGSNQSYQKAGTIMHEMLHGIGVIPWADTEWSRFNLRSGTSNATGSTTGSGLWLGDRVTDVLRFWDNNATEQLNGDYQHMWPYGINGASEDNGTDVLYIGNSLVCQALGEDGLQHTNTLFAEPYHAFEHQDGVKYYIKNEDSERGLYTAYLMPTGTNTLVWKDMTADEAAANDSCAWLLSFTPANQYYQLRNAATGQYMTYTASSIRTIATATAGGNENFQLMKGRVDVGSKDVRGFWIIHPTANWSPACLQANAGGAVTAATFNIANAATTQRWLILDEQEMRSLNQLLLADMLASVNKKLSQIKALMAVPHTEDQNGVDATMETSLASIEQRMAVATTTGELQTLLDEAEQAAFDFLANATPSDMEQPFDLTYMLVNPDMDSTDGWSDSPTISYSCAEYYEKTFDFNQTIGNLPAGTYQLRCNAFQRPGRAEECTTRTTTATVYAGAKSDRLAHVNSDAQASQQGGNESFVGGKYFPNNMQAASIYFSKGLYENRITTNVANDGGQLKVGLRCSSMPSYYWVIFDHFRLCYYGSLSPEDVDGMDITYVGTPIANRKGIYTIDGRRVAGEASDLERLPTGIYIIDGKKVVK